VLTSELECRNSKQCAPAKHHYDECVERVTSAEGTDDEGKEDCVEECKFHSFIEESTAVPSVTGFPGPNSKFDS
jgi:hypothetical protein